MDVDTGSFRALTGRMDELEEQVAALTKAVQERSAEIIASAIMDGLERAPYRPPARYRHLHLVPGEQ